MEITLECVEDFNSENEFNEIYIELKISQL